MGKSGRHLLEESRSLKEAGGQKPAAVLGFGSKTIVWRWELAAAQGLDSWCCLTP